VTAGTALIKTSARGVYHCPWYTPGGAVTIVAISANGRELFRADAMPSEVRRIEVWAREQLDALDAAPKMEIVR
jgi:hypothetical protein